MSDYILNFINQLLCYGDIGITDNPHQRAFDHRQRLESIAVKNPSGDARTLAPGESFSLVEATVSTGLGGGSTVEIKQVNSENSVYRLKVTAGPFAFRTPRSPTGLGGCVVTVNNSSVAVFDFTGATLTGVVVGDILRIAGANTYDTGPFSFNPINSGIWKIIGVNGTKVSVVREIGQAFQAVQETVTGPVTADVQIYADDVIRPGMKFQVSGTFSQVTQRTFEVQASSPYAIDFVSTVSIPEETGLTYVPGSIVFYTGVKRMIYIEVDQECSIRFNGQSDDGNRITPVKASDKMLRGSMAKWGDTYSCQVVNKSTNSCSMKFFTVE